MVESKSEPTSYLYYIESCDLKCLFLFLPIKYRHPPKVLSSAFLTLVCLYVLGLCANGSKICISEAQSSQNSQLTLFPSFLSNFPFFSFLLLSSPVILLPSLSHFKHFLSICYMLATGMGTPPPWCSSHSTFISSSVLNRRKQRLREFIQLAKGEQLASVEPGLLPIFFPEMFAHFFMLLRDHLTVSECAHCFLTFYPCLCCFLLFCQNSTYSSR